MLGDKTVDVAYALLLEYLVDGNQDARLLDIAETIVDGGSEELHRGTEVHIGIDERRDVVPQVAYLTVEHAVVFLEVVMAEYLGQFVIGSLNNQRFHRYNEVLLVIKMLAQEVENHISAATDIAGIHRNLTEEILELGIEHGEGAKAVPEVVEGEDALGVFAHILVAERHKRTPQLYGVGCVLGHKLLGEVEHVTRGKHRLSLVVYLPIGTYQIAIATDDFFLFRIPYYQLPAAILHGIKLVDICRLARTTTGSSESLFAQTPYLEHHVGRFLCRNDINLVMALVGHTHTAFGRKLSLEQFPTDGLDNFLFHNYFFIYSS